MLTLLVLTGIRSVWFRSVVHEHMSRPLLALLATTGHSTFPRLPSWIALLATIGHAILTSWIALLAPTGHSTFLRPTSCIKFVLEKPPVVKAFPTFRGTRLFVTASLGAFHPSQSRARSTQSTAVQVTTVRSVGKLQIIEIMRGKPTRGGPTAW